MLICSAAVAGRERLEILFVDVEGGAATLILTPAGETILVDAGWPPEPDRGFGRITAALREARVTRIDYFIATHFHAGHVGGLEALARSVEIARFLDHGESVEMQTDAGRALWRDYVRLAGNRRTVVSPGDEIPLRGAQLKIVASAGRGLASPLDPVQRANPFCNGAAPAPGDFSENAQSVGYVLAMGEFRFLSLGDLTLEREHELACPVNLIGEVDLLQASHHGRPESGPPALIRALVPAAVVVNNGPRSIDAPAALRALSETPGLEVWQLHAVSAPDILDAAPVERIANSDIDGSPDGAGIRVDARADGTFEIRNLRNHHVVSHVER